MGRVIPILFSSSMIRALLDGRKTQTRRILKRQPKTDRNGMIQFQDSGWFAPHVMEAAMHCAGVKKPYHAGDLLWVREAWRTPMSMDTKKPSVIVEESKDAGWHRGWCPTHWEADGTKDNWKDWYPQPPGRLRASMHLPQDFSRIVNEVIGIKVKRLQEISEEDALAEGVVHRPEGTPITNSPYGVRIDDTVVASGTTARNAYRNLWEWINGAGSWETNPWVIALTFRVHRANVLDFIKQREAA